MSDYNCNYCMMMMMMISILYDMLVKYSMVHYSL